MADKFLNETGLTAVWAKIKALLSGKVDKVTGKGLSSNDYTDDEKANVVANTTVRHLHDNKAVIDEITADRITAWDTVDGKLPLSGGTLTGKLATKDIAVGGEIIVGNGNDINIASMPWKIKAGSNGLFSYTSDNLDIGTVIKPIRLVGRNARPSYGVFKGIAMQYSDLALLSDIPDTSGFVTAESGKGLSSNDFTSAYKSKLDGIADGANKTTVDSALNSTSENPVQNKAVNSALAGKANSTHTHTKSQITDFPNIPDIGTISNTRIDAIIV